MFALFRFATSLALCAVLVRAGMHAQAALHDEGTAPWTTGGISAVITQLRGDLSALGLEPSTDDEDRGGSQQAG